MKFVPGVVLIVSIALMPVPALAEKCSIVDIEVDHDPFDGGQFKTIASVYVSAKPYDEQRVLNGSAMIYYKIEDNEGHVSKSATFSYVSDVIPAGKKGTDLELGIFTVGGEIVSITDVRFSDLSCSY